MKKLALSVLAIIILASCNEKQESKKPIKNTIENTEIMIKEEKQKIEALLSEYKKITELIRCETGSKSLHERWCVHANRSSFWNWT